MACDTQECYLSQSRAGFALIDAGKADTALLQNVACSLVKVVLDHQRREYMRAVHGSNSPKTSRFVFVHS